MKTRPLNHIEKHAIDCAWFEQRKQMHAAGSDIFKVTDCWRAWRKALFDMNVVNVEGEYRVKLENRKDG